MIIPPKGENEAVLNIGAVSRLTGIPITSLHAWERRYGFPSEPARTPGGHRLYSERDVILLRCVKAQIEQGVTVHQAVLSVLRSEQSGTIPPGHPTVSPSVAALGSIPIILSERLNSHLAENDIGQAAQLLSDLSSLYSTDDLILRVIGPAYAYIGEQWAQGRLSVATEHLASNFLKQKLMMWMEYSPVPTKPGLIGLACAPGEWHEGSLLMLAVLLRQRGWPIAYLGQNVPLEDLAGFIQRSKPSAIVLVAMTEEPAKALTEWPRWIHGEQDVPLVAFGGRAFVMQPEMIPSIPGHYLGDTVESGLTRLIEFLA